MKKIEKNWGSWEKRVISTGSITGKILSILFIFQILIFSCNWLDVIPDNLPTIDDAFKNRAAAEKSLFSCYRYLPNPISSYNYPAYFTSRDEFELGTNINVIDLPATRIAIGEQNTTSPVMDFWSGGNGATSMFEAIRTCNIFLEEIYNPRDLLEYERKRWIAEVKFLKAYYHFFLMQLYGPIPLIKENSLISATPEEVRVFREPIDECVAYIVELLDEAAPDLPLIVTSPIDEDGRITKPIALAVKAKVLVWGASPLFNGNPDYQSWKDKRGKQLVSDTYSKEKWENAAVAIREAIDVSHSAGNQLYIYNKLTTPQTLNMNDSLLMTMHIRKAITDKWNMGNVWSSSADPLRSWGQNNLQKILFPILYPEDLIDAELDRGLASFNMAELFYTNQGIPIEEDVNWNYADRYTLRTSTVEAENGFYIPIGQQTVSLHFDREPRFYASLGFDRGFYELSTTSNDFGASFTMYLRLRRGEPGNTVHVNNTGYYVKKLIAYETKGNPFLGYDYRFPLIRLADLYLLYSEALNEIKDRPDHEVYEWIDPVRAIYGLKGVVEAWRNSKYPNRPQEKAEMRKIIQQERLIEFAFEGQRFYDLRRWKLYESSKNYVPVGWNFNGATAEEYYTKMEVAQGLKFSVRDYLWPVKNSDLRINPNLVQSFGW